MRILTDLLRTLIYSLLLLALGAAAGFAAPWVNWALTTAFNWLQRHRVIAVSLIAVPSIVYAIGLVNRAIITGSIRYIFQPIPAPAFQTATKKRHTRSWLDRILEFIENCTILAGGFVVGVFSGMSVIFLWVLVIVPFFFSGFYRRYNLLFFCLCVGVFYIALWRVLRHRYKWQEMTWGALERYLSPPLGMSLIFTLIAIAVDVDKFQVWVMPLLSRSGYANYWHIFWVVLVCAAVLGISHMTHSAGVAMSGPEGRVPPWMFKTTAALLFLSWLGWYGLFWDGLLLAGLTAHLITGGKLPPA